MKMMCRDFLQNNLGLGEDETRLVKLGNGYMNFIVFTLSLLWSLLLYIIEIFLNKTLDSYSSTFGITSGFQGKSISGELEGVMRG